MEGRLWGRQVLDQKSFDVGVCPLVDGMMYVKYLIDSDRHGERPLR